MLASLTRQLASPEMSTLFAARQCMLKLESIAAGLGPALQQLRLEDMLQMGSVHLHGSLGRLG